MENGSQTSTTPLQSSQAPNNAPLGQLPQAGIPQNNPYGFETFKPIFAGDEQTIPATQLEDVNIQAAKPTEPSFSLSPERLAQIDAAYGGDRKELNKGRNSQSSDSGEIKFTPESERKGNRATYLYNKVLDGIGSVASGTIDLANQFGSIMTTGQVDATPLTRKLYREYIAPDVRSYLKETIGANVDKGREAKYEGETVTSALGGVFNSAPAMALTAVSGGAGVGALFTQSYDGALQSINSTEEGRNLDEATKTFFAGGVAAATAALEKYSFDKIFKGQTGIVGDAIARQALKNASRETGGKVTGDIFSKFLDREIVSLSNKFLKGGARLADASIVEYVTEALQEGAQAAGELLINKTTGKPVFDTSETSKWDGFLARMNKAGVMGAIGGAFMGGLSMGISNLAGVPKAEIDEKQTRLTDINTALENEALSDSARELLVQEKIKLQNEAQNIADEVDKTYEQLDEKQKDRVNEIVSEQVRIEEAIADENIPDSVKENLTQQAEVLDKELSEIKPAKNERIEFIKEKLDERIREEEGYIDSITSKTKMGRFLDRLMGVTPDGEYLQSLKKEKKLLEENPIEYFNRQKQRYIDFQTEEGQAIEPTLIELYDKSIADATSFEEQKGKNAVSTETTPKEKGTVREEIVIPPPPENYNIVTDLRTPTTETVSVEVKKSSDVSVGDAVELVDGKKATVQAVEGNNITMELEDGTTLTANPKMVEIFKPTVNEEQQPASEIINEETTTPTAEETVTTPREESVDVTLPQEEKIPQEPIAKPKFTIKGETVTPKLEPKTDAEVIQPTDSDGGGNGTENKGTTEKSGENVTGITQEATAQAREQMGIEAYEKTSQTNEQRRAKTEKAIKDGYNVKQLVQNIKASEDFVPSRQEFEILKIYENSLTAAIQKNPTSEMIAERADLLRTIDVSTSRAGSSLQAIAGLEATEDNLANFLQAEAVHFGVDQLPQNIIDDLKAKYEAGQAAKEAYEKGYEKAKQELIKQQAELELAKQRKRNKPSEKKTKADYASERADLKKSIKDKLKKARGQLNAVPVPYLNELIAIAPDVAKLVKSYVEEGISKLDDIVKKVHEDLSDEIAGITEQDVLDLISGEYNAKKPTKTEILSQVRDLREQAKLLKKIQDLEDGKIPSDPVKQVRRNAELEKLREQVKELEDEAGITAERTLKSRRTALDNKIKQLQEDLELGNFDLEPAEPRRVRLDAETQKKQDEYIEFLRETNRRRDQAMYEQQSSVTKAWLKFQQVLGLRRLIQTSIDFSMPFRQAVTVTLNPRYVPTTLRSFANMFKSTFSEKAYGRIMFDIQQDPLYQDMRIDGLMFSEVDSKDNLKREEDFRTSFLYQIPYLREPFLASNRAAAGYINTARYNLYLKGVERLRAQGITHENAPENYEALAKWTMNMTGRGNLLSFMEKGENASKWQRIMGDTFYGTRLMASRFNMLNPNYYVKMPKEQRIEALKDIGSYVGLSAAVAFAAIAAGADVSTDPEDADFLKAKWGNKRYDLFTGGMNTYLRTAYRLMKAIYQRTNPKLYGENKDTKALKKANKYGTFAVKSGTDFFRYKLAPNTSYVLSATLGKDPLGQPFNPNDFLKFYPMYVDDFREASKKDNGFVESMSILAPSLFGIGVQEYDNKKKSPTKEKE